MTYDHIISFIPREAQWKTENKHFVPFADFALSQFLT